MPQLHENSVSERVQYPFPALALLVGLAFAPLLRVLGRVPRAVRLAPVIALGLAAFLATVGCAGAVPVRAVWGDLGGDERPVSSPEVDALLEDAGAVLGLELVPVGHAAGAVTVDLIEPAEGEATAGRCLLRAFALRVVRSKRDPLVLAHEIGHALGLEHVADPENVMYPTVRGGRILTPEQRKRMRRGLIGLRPMGAR